MARLTLRRLNAMDNALSAMLAGEDNTGDWDEAVTRADLEAASEWVSAQINKRQAALKSTAAKEGEK
ncbi:hypothetical protein [uncultured Brevundimonas sp.]|uniref:hypothetical protein n=1 Tax=uncultured Brevundimonas sp. TaxID=213418 RepID=UPI0025E3041F|nr:hypothetical protein [uncultured Brevundimonas sp.]